MGRFFLMLHSDTIAIGRVLDVVWYDLSVAQANGSFKYPKPGNFPFVDKRKFTTVAQNSVGWVTSTVSRERDEVSLNASDSVIGSASLAILTLLFILPYGSLSLIPFILMGINLD